MNKAQLYTRSNVLQRRDAESVLEEYGHLLRSSSKDPFIDSSSSSSASASSDWEDEEQVTAVNKDQLSRLLDIGTGSGDVLVDFVAPIFGGNCHFVGTDISEEMVRFGRDNYSSTMDNVEFDRLDIANDVQSFLNSHKRFNHITSFYCLHWIQNQLVAMRNIHRLLQPNGNCLMAFIGKMAIFDIYEEMAQTRQWSKFMYDVDNYVSPYQHVDDPAEHAKELMQEAGFKDVVVESKKLTFHYCGIPNLRSE